MGKGLLWETFVNHYIMELHLQMALQNFTVQKKKIYVNLVWR